MATNCNDSFVENIKNQKQSEQQYITFSKFSQHETQSFVK